MISRLQSDAEPKSERQYVGALDGLRAIAVGVVMAYHGGLLRGGFLGVDLFFVLSGFLITTLLLEEWDRTGRIGLKGFWARRARRLLPGLFLLILLVSFYATVIVPRGTYPGLRGDGLATLLYVANWHAISAGTNYFVVTGLPSLLTHTWSLAIEEQFYLLWPLLVVALLKWRQIKGVAALSCILALASAIEMGILYHEGSSLTRLYYGTDTHAQCLLIGATLSCMVLLRPSLRAIGRSAADGAGFLGLASFVALVILVHFTSGFLWEGGFFLVAIAGVLLVLGALGDGLFAHVLSFSPLRYIGKISYGMYLFHFPLFQWIDGQRTGLTGASLFGLRSLATVVVASASYHLIEHPLRFGHFRRAWMLSPVVIAGVVAVLFAATEIPSVAAPVQVPPHHHIKAKPTSVLIIGDSTALTLGVALGGDEATYNITLHNYGILGCGVTQGTEVEMHGVISSPPFACNTQPAPPGTPLLNTTGSPNAMGWMTFDQQGFSKFHPKVVMILAGRWEEMTRFYDGQWTNITQPMFATYVRDQLEQLATMYANEGAKVDLLTAPCDDSGERPTGNPWPEDDLDRVQDYNDLVQEAASATGAAVIDLYAMVCPNTMFQPVIDGTTIRMSDGVHFSYTSHTYLGPKIWPLVAKLAKQHS